MAKTIEGIFHPRSLKIRHNILKMQRGSATAVGEGSGAVAGGGTTVRGKSRDDIQKLFMDVLRDVSWQIPCQGISYCCEELLSQVTSVSINCILGSV